MGVRVDRPGRRWMDYHTTGAGIGVLAANGKIKRTEATGELETVLSSRFYLADASFLVALMGPHGVTEMLARALESPRWPVFLGRRSCPPAVPVLAGVGRHADLRSALTALPWQPRLKDVDDPPSEWRCVLEANPGDSASEIRHDVPLSFDPPRYGFRYVRQDTLSGVTIGPPLQTPVPRAAANLTRYDVPEWKERRKDRLDHDAHQCVFCRRPAETVHHTTYARANAERREDLRSLCRLCHDAVTMLEGEYGFVTVRVDPLEPHWREFILAKRDEILRRRTLQHPAGRSE
jgi:CRISPR-associated protein Cas5/CasD subtype I-E